MPASGKYDFPGIKKLGAAGLRLALMQNPQTAWIAKIPLSNLMLEFFANWLANNGLVMLNIGAIYVSGEIDQMLFDQHMDKAIEEIKRRGGVEKLTPEQKKAIDDEVIKAARDFIVINNGSK